MLDWSLRENVGFSAFVSIGSMLDVNWGDLIDYFGNDPRTHSIVIYMESIGDARSFLSAAREVSLTKPVIVIKAGRTAAAAKAAASHTGALTGSDEVLDAAFRRSGVLRVNSIADIFFMSDVLAKQPRPRGNRLCIVTNAGGPGVLATDALVAGGGELAELSAETMKAFDEILPAQWSHNNPVDILGDAEPERYAKSLEIAAKDPSIDGMLVVLTPQDMTNPTQIAEKLKPYAKGLGKPVLASWMGGAEVAAGEQILNQAGIPTFQFPDSAVRAFNYMWRYAYNLKGLYETPALPQHADAAVQRGKAERIIHEVRQSGRTILTEYESKQLLKAYDIPTVETRIAATEQEALEAAEEIGYPIVLKLYSLTITHKTDVGGVQLNLRDANAVKTRVPDHQAGGHGESWRRALPGRDRAADGEARRLRADYRQQPGFAVRAGDSVRHRRPAGRGLQGPRPGAAAAELHAGAAHDGADQDLQGAEGRARPQAGRSGGAGGAAGALQPAGRRAALDQGDRHQSAAGFAGAAAGAGCAGGGAWPGDERGQAADARDPSLSDPPGRASGR